MNATSTPPVGVGIVGCGNISGAYAKNLAGYPEVRLIGAFDADQQRAAQFAEAHDCRTYATLEEMLADETVQLVTNLTPPSLHVEVTEACLRASRHVYSEKPLALTSDQAVGLVRLAQDEEVRLGCSPSVWLAPAQQAAWREVASGRLGDVRLVYAEVNQGRVESWHPAPQSFYDVGPLFDAGVYPIAYLTAVFGPVRRVTAYASMLKGERVTTAGVPFAPGSEDLVIAILETADGVTIRLTCNFYVTNDMSQRGIEFHGDKGSVQLDSWFQPDAGVRVAAFGEGYRDVSLGDEATSEVEWARGVQDMARAISEDRPHLATGEHAAHVVEVLNGILQAAREERPVPIASDFPKPQPLD